MRHIDYLVGGLRIGLDATSHTPGPRSHILGVVSALRSRGVETRLFLASSQPMLRRFARMPEGSAAGGRAWRTVGDVVRVLACAWSLLMIRRWSRESAAEVVYERAAVMQCLGLGHRRRRTSLYVVESNGIFSRETAADRHALGSTRVAAAFERLVYRKADLVVVVSEHLRAEVCSFARIPASKVSVIPNGVRDDVFTMPRQTTPGRRVVGFAGSLVPWQRLDLLVAGAARVHGDLEIEVIGDGPELGRLRSIARQTGAGDRVAFLGRQNHEQTLRRMAGWTAGYAAHAATSSDLMYHSPLKLYEYAGLGLDLIVARTPDAELLMDAGLRVAFIDDDAESVAAALRQHLDAPAPTAGELARIRAHLQQRHSWSARVDDLLERMEKCKAGTP